MCALSLAVSVGFQTDSQIGKKSTFNRKDRDARLQKWVPAEGGATNDQAFEKTDIGGWDQFTAAANTEQRKLSKAKPFDLDDYSTPIDRDSEFYKKREAYAAKVARAINSKCTTNIHLAMERNQVDHFLPLPASFSFCFVLAL